MSASPALVSLSSDDLFCVSVVVAAYNAEDTIGECLASLDLQTLESLEVVIVDDGSTDGTLREIGEFAAKSAKSITILSQPNGGQGNARNLALAHCQGEYIGFLDADDFVLPEMFEMMYRAAVAENADLVRCGMRCFTGNGSSRIYSKIYLHPQKGDLFKRMQVQPYLHLVKSTLVSTHQITFAETRGSEDIAFFLKLFPHVNQIACIDKPYVCRRVLSGSTSSTATVEKCSQIFPVIDEVLAYYKNHGLLKRYGKLLEYSCVRLLMCSRVGWCSLIEDGRSKREMIRLISSFITKRFPGRSKNGEMHGMMGLYLRYGGKISMLVALPLLSRRYKSLLGV